MKFLGKFLRFGNIYACVAGDHVGKLLIFIEKRNGDYGFLTIPEMKNLWVPKEKFDFGLNNGILDYIERVPKHVRQTSEVKFRENSEEFQPSV